MKLFSSLFIFLLLTISNWSQSPMDVTTQKGSLQWNRLPTDAEIEAAVIDLKNSSGGFHKCQW
jgi:hypothetical protein